MYVGLKQPRGDGERYVTPARGGCEGDYMGTTKFTRLAEIGAENGLDFPSRSASRPVMFSSEKDAKMQNNKHHINQAQSVCMGES